MFRDGTDSTSFLHLARVIIKLVPIAIALRRDRMEWIKKEGEGVDTNKFIKHAHRALRTFISLGPSYIKLGQWLSTRSDILPEPYLDVLSNLQDNVPPSTFNEVETIINAEIGEISKLFDEFDTNAISAASLGQVYLAVYKGKRVIVKVRRPNIENIVNFDISVLKKLLPFATKFIDPNLKFSAESMLSQFIETIYDEMNYELEMNNLLKIKHDLRHEKITIPDVISKLTTKKVIVQEYLDGIKITDIAELEKNNIDRQKLIVNLHYVFFKMLLKHDIFHSDPHPGNISVTKDGTLILYDFGMVGKLDPDTRLKLIRLYLGLIDRDASRTVNVLMELGMLSPDVNRYVVERAISLSIKALHGKKIDRSEVNFLLDLSNKTMSKFPFRLPKNLALYIRMGSLLEGIYKYHQIDFKFVTVLSKLIENEGLVRDAYKEEVKFYFQRLVKNIDDLSYTGTLVRNYLENRQFPYNNSSRHLLYGSIISSSILIGSCILSLENKPLSIFGFTLSVSMFVYMFLKIKRER